MKCLYTILLSAAITVQSYGQKISFTDNNVWIFNVTIYHQTNPITHYYNYDTAMITVDSVNYHWLTSYRGPNWYDSILVRKDSSGSKIYARVYSAACQTKALQYMDTNEHLLYDFNMQLGDTFKYKNFVHYVSKVDSIKLNGAWHRVLLFTGTDNFLDEYHIIEGLGCTKGFVFPFAPLKYGINDGYMNLTCFKTNGNIPTVSTTNSFSYTFDSTCFLSIKETNKKENNIKIYPQPAHDKITIALPGTLQHAQLTIINATGQTIYSDNNISGKNIYINNPGVSGICYYIIKNGSGNRIAYGKLFFY